MAITEFKELLIIYFKDLIDDVSIYTIPFEWKEMFLNRLAKDKYIEIEGVVLRTSYIVKCEPLTSVDPIKYKLFTAPYSIRALLIRKHRSDAYNSIEHLQNHIDHLLASEKSYV